MRVSARESPVGLAQLRKTPFFTALVGDEAGPEGDEDDVLLTTV